MAPPVERSLRSGSACVTPSQSEGDQKLGRIALPCLALASIAVVQPAVAASTFWTANDPFVGKWRLENSRSTIVDDMRVQAVGPNRDGFSFEGEPAEVISTDGTDQ